MNARIVLVLGVAIAACTSSVMSGNGGVGGAGGGGSVPVSTSTASTGGGGGAGGSAASSTTGLAGADPGMVWVCDGNNGLIMLPPSMIPPGDEVCGPGKCCGGATDIFHCCDPTTENCCPDHDCIDPRCVNDGEGGYYDWNHTPDPDAGP